MRNKTTRREVLYLGGLLAASAGPSLLLNGKEHSPPIRRFECSLPVPPVLTPVRTDATTDYYEITQKESQLEILPGLRTTIWGYDGLLPGPTLLIQDRVFAPDGSLRYKTFDHLGAESGTILVNGAPWPHMEVGTRKYRFRIVNGSNATPLRLALSSGNPLVQIATEGGLLPAPVLCPSIPLAMAERVEVIVDFSAHPVGTKLVLQNLNKAGASGPISDEIMQFRITRQDRDYSVVPERLCEFLPISVAEVKRSRHFVLSAKPSFGFIPIVNWRINGTAFDPDRSIVSPLYGDVEIWHFTNRRFLGLLSMVHPMHIHLVHFLIMERDGRPPLPHETGWKDTVAVDKDEEVSVIARFEPYAGRYLLHCHNLEHEDHSMMARFDVVR